MKKVALVTGASRGIGAAIAKLLASHGHAVCVNYFNGENQANQLVDLIQRNGGEAIAVKADMSSENDIVHLFEKIHQQLGPVSALVNNAGINGGTGTVEEITLDRLQSVFATNVYGTFLCCREAVRHMKQLGHGSIVNVSSEAAKFGGNQLAHYAASKAAINTFTIAFAREVAAHNIRVNTVSPGVIDTDIHASSSPERIANLMNSLPMKRMGTVNEVAELIFWLLSDAASYISGSIVPVTGSR